MNSLQCVDTVDISLVKACSFCFQSIACVVAVKIKQTVFVCLCLLSVRRRDVMGSSLLQGIQGFIAA